MTDVAFGTNVSTAQKADFANLDEQSQRFFADIFWRIRYEEVAGQAIDHNLLFCRNLAPVVGRFDCKVR
ncbi:hypothetical protein [Ruegeria atlantica]|uniref:hypothetical protein n=1 Tax=Ruegeria atlantica TaxID=81569 RepID=UPI00071DC971|nr:hypothetical protein [Ruegeria atlantica]